MDSMEEILFEEDLRYHLFTKFVSLLTIAFISVMYYVLYIKLKPHIILIIIFLIIGMMVVTITILMLKRRRLYILKKHFILKFFPFETLFQKKIPIQDIYRILLNENSQEIEIFLHSPKKSIRIDQVYTKDLRKVTRLGNEIGIPLEIIKLNTKKYITLKGYYED